MGGYSRQRKSSSFSFFSMFKSCCSHGRDEYYWDEGGRRVWASDEDRGRWTAEPGIDRKATAFINRFYETRVSDPERQTLAV